MKYINSILYLEFTELLNVGISETTIRDGYNRGSTSWVKIDDPADKRKVLIQYSTLKEIYKTLVVAKYGDPHKHFSSQIINQHLTNKPEDIQYITSFTLPDGTYLPANKQSDYITACSFLNLLSNLNARNIRSLGYNSSADFYSALCGIIKSDSIALPYSYPKLKRKVAEYKINGAQCVISKKWCNKNALKISDEVCEAVLLEMIAHHLQFDDSFVARKYNKWATTAGYKDVTDATVGNWRRKHLLTITASREGQSVWHNKFGKQIHRERPSAPLLLINGDDNHLDYYFKTVDTKYGKVVLYVITDAFNDYPLGYSVDWKPSIQGIQSAFLNAIHHIKELTGEYLWWHQLQTDSWAIKTLTPFFKASIPDEKDHQVNFTPTKVKNARGKSIERSFGKEWHTNLKECSLGNYTGHNITAKTKPNFEVMWKAASQYPEIGEAMDQIAHFINKVRTDDADGTKKSKQQTWIDAYRAMPEAKKKYLTAENRLLIYGKKHIYVNAKKEGNKLTTAGFTLPFDSGRKMFYDVPTEAYKQHIGKTMNIVYDPYDLSNVLAVMDDARVRVLCPLFQKTKMALADMVDGDRMLLNSYLSEQKSIGQFSLDTQAQRQSKIGEVDGLMLSGVARKEDKYLAENNYYESLTNEDTQLNSHYPSDDDDDIFDKELKYNASL